MTLSKKIFSVILIGGLLTMTGQPICVDAAENMELIDQPLLMMAGA